MKSSEIRNKVNDMIIIANIIKEAIGCEDGWKMFKLSFLFDYEAYKKNVHGLNSEFFRYDNGAWSKDLRIILNALLFNKYITNQEVAFSLSRTGYELLDKINELVNFKKTDQNDIIVENNIKYSKRSGRDLMFFHYELILKNKIIKDYPFYKTLLDYSDFKEIPSFVDDLEEEEINEIYSMFMFPKTYNKTDMEYTEIKDLDQLLHNAI